MVIARPTATSVSRIVQHRRRAAYSTLKLLIALVVLAGGCWTAITAFRQLQDRDAEISAEITELEQQVQPRVPAEVLDRLEQLRSQRLTASNFQWDRLVAAAACYALAMLISGGYWYFCLLAFGQNVKPLIVLAVHMLGQLGKYVPGKALVLVIRSSGLKRHAGVEAVPAVLGIFIETLTMMACGATWAGIAITALPAPWWLRSLAACIALAAAIPTLPPLFRLVLRRLEKSRFGQTLPQANQAYDWRLMLQGWLLMSLVWFLIGSSFWCLVLATPGANAVAAGWTGWVTATATISLAVVAGFLSLIPGGAGVREIVITVLLAPLVGAGPAMVAAVLARLLFLLVEVILAGFSTFFLRRLTARSCVQ